MTDYKPGNYESDRDITVFKALSSESNVSAAGKIEKTYGTWQNDDNNIIKFEKGKKKTLTAVDLQNRSIKQLLRQGILKQVL